MTNLLNPKHGDEARCEICGDYIVFCEHEEGTTTITGWATMGSAASDGFVCVPAVGSEHVWHVPTTVQLIESDTPVYNDLPAPFGQEYANLYTLIEDFINRALQSGIHADKLHLCLSTDVDLFFTQ
jgi:hypothetical protein